jgi:hypothetical protein
LIKVKRDNSARDTRQDSSAASHQIGEAQDQYDPRREACARDPVATAKVVTARSMPP